MQQHGTHTQAAVIGLYRHSAYVPIGQQPPCSQGLAMLVVSYRMNAMLVIGIHFEFNRNTLLLHKYSMAYGGRVGLAASPVANNDVDILVHLASDRIRPASSSQFQANNAQYDEANTAQAGNADGFAQHDDADHHSQ